MFIHKSGNQALAFRSLSKLTDALYPITFLDVLAFHGSYFKAIILQAGRMLVGFLETKVSAPCPSSTCPATLASAPPSILHTPGSWGPPPLIFQRATSHPISLSLSVFFLPASSSPLQSPSLALPPQCPLSSNPLWPLPSTFSTLLPLTPPSVFDLVSNHQSPSQFSMDRNTCVTFLMSTCQEPTILSFQITISILPSANPIPPLKWWA